MPTPTYRALAGGTRAGRQISGVVARIESPRNTATSPAVERWKPLSVDTYSTELTASVQQLGDESTSGSRDSPRPLVFDIEVGRRLPDDVDDARPLQRLTTMPRPDTPSNVWSVAKHQVPLNLTELFRD